MYSTSSQLFEMGGDGGGAFRNLPVYTQKTGYAHLDFTPPPPSPPPRINLSFPNFLVSPRKRYKLEEEAHDLFAVVLLSSNGLPLTSSAPALFLS